MANEEHLAILSQGVEAWNKWREKNPNTAPDLSGANLTHAYLSGANLSKTDLSEAHLRYANLRRANLMDAKLNWADLLYAHLSGADLRGAKLGGANLYKAGLGGANLSGADLDDADLREADLSETNLSGTSLMMAHLRQANLIDANLNGADLSDTNLSEAHLMDANLSETDLNKANLNGADLNGANVEGAILWSTTFGDVDLSEVKGLDKIEHRGPSTVGIDTIYASKGKIPEAFLRGCGVPDKLIAYIPSLLGQPWEFYSCFISHSNKDKRFCDRLYADLQAKHVRTWYFPEDATWGKSVWGEIDRSIKIYDKLVVICSENSLQSGPVLREIERALNREDREGKDILFPVCIDDCIFKKWEHPRKADVLAKVVGDFQGWKRSAAKYDKAFKRLLAALQAEDKKP